MTFHIHVDNLKWLQQPPPPLYVGEKCDGELGLMTPIL